MPEPSEPARRRTAPITATGTVVAALGAATTAVGLVVGLVELTGLGISLVALVVVAVVALRGVRPTVHCARVLGASRAIAGATVTVQITATHVGSGHSRQLRLADPIVYPDGRTSTARQSIRPLAAGETETTTYGLRVAHRGICTVGPLRLKVTDPFGLARRLLPGPGVTHLTVLPRIETIEAPSLLVESEDHVEAPPANTHGSEFSSLREYARGDDLRKVHWRTSARRDELVVRRDAEPHRPGCTVVLDVRAPWHDATTFERAVSAAASILAAAGRIRQPTRLCTTAGFDSTRASGSHQLDLVLGMLAVVEPSTGPPVVPDRGQDPVIVLTTSAGVASLDAVTAMGAATTTVVFASPTDAAGAPADTAMVVGPDDEFPTVWDRHLAATGRRARTPLGAW